MNTPAWLIESGIYLGAAVIAAPLFKRLGLGAVLGYLIAGIVIGPSALGLISDPERVLHFAEFGVVLLLFLIGLELEPERAWELRKPIFGLGGLQVATSIGLVTAAGIAFGLGWRASLVAGMGIAMSSTAIGLATLDERKQRATVGGQASFAVLLFQDLAVIPLFIVLALIAPGAGDGMSWMNVVKAIAVIVAIVFMSRTIVRPLMRVIAQTGLREVFLAFSLLLVVGVSVAVQSVGLSMALGTFLAGVLLADSEYRYELQLDIEPAKGLLLGLFFIAVGMSVDLAFIAAHPGLVLGLAAAVVLGKWALLYGLARPFYCGKPGEARLFATALSQIGEFAFVIYNTALGQNTLDRPVYNALNAAVAVSMLSTPLLFVLLDKFTAHRIDGDEREPDAIDERRPVIVAGFGRFGQIVVRVLTARGIPATTIDRDPNQIELLRDFGWRCYYGDASRLDLLEQAGIAQARLLVIAIDDAAAAVEIAKLVRARWPHLPIVARARSRTDAYEFEELGIRAIRETFHSALEAAEQSLRALGDPAHSAWRLVRHFERHDREMLERARRVRGDRQALISLSEQGRRDLQSLLESERAQRSPDDASMFEDGWTHLHAPDEPPAEARAASLDPR